MTAKTVEQATEDIYVSLNSDNADIDAHISNLQKALQAADQKEALFDPSRLAQNNRQGRKTMQSYFRKRGIKVVFDEPPSR